MRGVAGEEHAAIHEAVGDRALSHPEVLVLDRVGDVAAHEAAHQRRDVGVLQPALVEIDELKPPQILAVDDREKRPRAFRPDEDVAKRLALVVLRGQSRECADRSSSTSRCAVRRGFRCRAARAPCWQSRRSRRDIGARTVSCGRSAGRASVAVTPSASCTKLSSLTRCRNVTCGNDRA